MASNSRADRVIKDGIVQIANARWQSNVLGALAGRGQLFVYVSSPAADTTHVTVSDKDGTVLATARKMRDDEPDTPPPPPKPAPAPAEATQLPFDFDN